MFAAISLITAISHLRMLQKQPAKSRDTLNIQKLLMQYSWNFLIATVIRGNE